MECWLRYRKHFLVHFKFWTHNYAGSRRWKRTRKNWLWMSPKKLRRQRRKKWREQQDNIIRQWYSYYYICMYTSHPSNNVFSTVQHNYFLWCNSPYQQNTQQTHVKNITAFSGIRTRDPSSQAAAHLRLRPHGHRNGRVNALLLSWHCHPVAGANKHVTTVKCCCHHYSTIGLPTCHSKLIENYLFCYYMPLM